MGRRPTADGRQRERTSRVISSAGLRPRAAGPTMILGIETSCDETAVALLERDGSVRVSLNALRYAAPAALALFGAFVLLLHGLAAGPASVLVPVAQMSFVITALAGVVLFHERLDARKSFGLAVAAAALVLFAVG